MRPWVLNPKNCINFYGWFVNFNNRPIKLFYPLLIVLYCQFIITRGILELGLSSSPGKPGINGMNIITLKSYDNFIAFWILLQIASMILFFTAPFGCVADIKNWFYI